MWLGNKSDPHNTTRAEATGSLIDKIGGLIPKQDLSQKGLRFQLVE
jgi:hypothetical protein